MKNKTIGVMKMSEIKTSGGVTCDGCSKFGYADEFNSPTKGIYLCVRCSMPHIHWGVINNGDENNAIHN